MKLLFGMLTVFLLFTSSLAQFTTDDSTGEPEPAATTADPDDSYVSCFSCVGNETECNVAAPSSQVMCAADSKCWSYYYSDAEGVVMVAKGCNITSMLEEFGYDGSVSCSDLMKDGEVCFEMNNEKHCFRCCDGGSLCNSFVLTGNQRIPSGNNGAAPITVGAITGLVVLFVFLSM